MENEEVENTEWNERKELTEHQAEPEHKKHRRPGFFTGLAAGMVLMLLLGIGAGTVLHVRTKDGTNSILTSQVQAKIKELTGYIHLYYYEDVDQEKLSDGLYAGLVEGLGDPYSGYFTKEEYENLQISATQNYYGIGAGLSQDKDTMQVTISHIYEGSPAEQAGLKEGDTIVKVDDIEGTSMELSELVTHIRGEEGSSVHLQIYREGESDYLEFDVKRASIDLPTVEYKLLGDNIGYIHILEFGAPTAEQFESAVADLNGQGMKAMIVDVRDNPGGMVTAVTQILDDILPEGVVVYTQDKYGKRQDFTSSGDTSMDLPIAVLMNGNSASASEIFAGAIRDFKYGTLIGTTTFGKGIVQTVYPLGDGDAIKLTTAKYYTPNGENIHGTGIDPDIELEYEYKGDKSGDYDEMQDNQVLKAIEVLSAQ